MRNDGCVTRLLVLGGTWFLGRQLVKDAIARGWEVTTFTRGRSGTPPEGVTHILHGDRSKPDDLRALAESGPWDATIDTSAYDPHSVTSALHALGEGAGRYVLISTVSAYRVWPGLGVSETSLLWPGRADARESDPDIEGMEPRFRYGILKAGCEAAAQSAPGGALVLRPGVILGPGEYVGRLLSLFERARRDGRWLLTDPERWIQPVDVRDVSAFALDMIQAGATGAYNVAAPPRGHATYADLIHAVLEASGGTAEPVWAAAQWLKDQGVRQWTEIPLWRIDPGTWQVKQTKAASAGLHCRPLHQTVADAWDDFGVRPPISHPRQAEHGMDPTKEADLLARWDEISQEPLSTNGLGGPKG